MWPWKALVDYFKYGKIQIKGIKKVLLRPCLGILPS